MIIFSHPTGNANVRAAAYGLLKNNLLQEFHTSIASFPGSLLDRFGNIEAFSEIRRRGFDIAIKPVANTWPWLEISRLLASRLGLNNLIQHEIGLFSIDAVFNSQDKRIAAHLQHVAKKGGRAVYAYEDGAAFSFREAKRLGIQCLYDLPIGYWRTARQLLQKEQEKWPQWATTLTGFKDSEKKLARKDEELRLADRIFVASSFTANTLKDYPGTLAPVEVIPYGFPPVTLNHKNTPVMRGKPLKLLFVGGLSQRKGIANLFTAVEGLAPHVSLTVVGHKVSHDCPPLDAALAKHNWIPSLPHHEVLKLMREQDVLVFPSLFEGFGLVITEAMSQGTPVITTERTAGPDLITHEENGWLVEAGSTHSLQQCIEDLLQKPVQIAKVGRAAMETARRRPWEVYGRELADAVRQHQVVSL